MVDALYIPYVNEREQKTMNAVSNKADMIDLMIENELAAADLYKQYAHLFRAHENPWEEMMQEERAHAEILKTLRKSVDRLTLTRSVKGFPTIAIQANVDFVRKETLLAQSGPMAMLRALSVCLSIEQAAVEHEFFTVFQPVSETMKQEFVALDEHTTDHVKRIEKCLVQEHARLSEATPISRMTRLGRVFTFLPI
jgi:hypothetical protein